MMQSPKLSGTHDRWERHHILRRGVYASCYCGGAGITGVTTAYELTLLGYQVTVVDRHLYPAMETSFANGGQLSACNAEVWNQKPLC